MRRRMAWLVAALGLALASTGPARAGTPWDITLPSNAMRDAVLKSGVGYMGPYWLQGETGTPQFKSVCLNGSIDIPQLPYTWHQRKMSAESPWLTSTSSGWYDGDSGVGLSPTNISKAAYLQMVAFNAPIHTGVSKVNQWGAIHEAIWRLTDVGYNPTTYLYGGTADYKSSQFWMNEANKYSDDEYGVYFDASNWSVLMPLGWKDENGQWHPTSATGGDLPPDPDKLSSWELISDPINTSIPPLSQVFLKEGPGDLVINPRTPEPGSMALLLVGVGLFGLQRRRSRSVAA